MYKISKEDIVMAFIGNKGKRNRLLFEYYKDLFYSGLNADIVARKISEDLNIKITINSIYKIRHRILKHELSKNITPKGTDNISEDKPKKFIFKNIDEYSDNDPFAKAFEGL